MNLKRISILFATLGTLFLYFLSILSEPVIVNIEDLPKYEGKKVTTKGIVSDYFTTKYASQMITIRGNNFTAVVFLEGTCDVEYGDEIQITGEVQKYMGDWEIIVDNKKNLKIVEKWDNISFPIWQLAQKPSRYLGLNVNVTGYIESIFDSYFYIVDIENEHSLVVFYGSYSGVSLYPGKKVCVSAKFLFDEKNLRYKLEICDENHGVFLEMNG